MALAIAASAAARAGDKPDKYAAQQLRESNKQKKEWRITVCTYLRNFPDYGINLKSR